MNPDATSPMAVVRRGETEVFRTLQARIEELDLANVIWDRRIEDRRGRVGGWSADRRHRERRRAKTETWVPLGFLLVGVGIPETTPRPVDRSRSPETGGRRPESPAALDRPRWD